MFAKMTWLALAGLALAACAPLRAERPLFAPADQIGPAPLTEGVWIYIDEECPARHATRRRRLPDACAPSELRREPDGAWVLRFIGRLPPNGGGPDAAPRALRIIIAPATERPDAVSFAPLYLAEYVALDANTPGSPHYAAVVPVGAMPAREMYVIGEIDCASILRDGPIEGVNVSRNERGDIVDCVASNQAAVRAAVRRATIEGLGDLLEEPAAGRFLFVRP